MAKKKHGPNPLNFNPPLPASSDALAGRVVETRDALNAIGTMEAALNPLKVKRLDDAYNRSLARLAFFLRVVGDIAGADTIANNRTCAMLPRLRPSSRKHLARWGRKHRKQQNVSLNPRCDAAPTVRSH